MGASPATPRSPLLPLEQLRLAREVLATEAAAVSRLAGRLDESFCAAVALIHACRGCVIVSGMGKAGLIGQKIAATLASVGVRSQFVHPAEAIHGDLGRIRSGDVAIVLSQSGETSETTRILPSLREAAVPIIALTCRRQSTLARGSDRVIDLGPLEEACPLGLAPTTSTTAMLAVGDALAIVASRMRGFTREDFARFHPGGNLGRKLNNVEDEMRPLAQCRLARDSDSVRSVFIHGRQHGRRSGAIMLVDQSGRLSGIFTDSDLARLFEDRREAAFDEPVARVMTRSPKSVQQGTRLIDAVNLMAAHKISELPVVSDTGAPLGMLDVTDVVGLMPEEISRDWLPSEPAAGPTPREKSVLPATLPFPTTHRP
jgi:arabinose-5-phosphate isomerase